MPWGDGWALRAIAWVLKPQIWGMPSRTCLSPCKYLNAFWWDIYLHVWWTHLPQKQKLYWSFGGTFCLVKCVKIQREKKLAGIHKLWINGVAPNQQYWSCPLCSGTAPGWPGNHLKLTVTFPNRFASFQLHSIPLQILREETWKNLSEHSSKDPNWKGLL